MYGKVRLCLKFVASLETSTQMWLVDSSEGGCLSLSRSFMEQLLVEHFSPFSSTTPGPVELCDPCVYPASAFISIVQFAESPAWKASQLSDPIVEVILLRTQIYVTKTFF